LVVAINNSLFSHDKINIALWGISDGFYTLQTNGTRINEKTILTVVTTVSRLGGEDKTLDIKPC